MAAPVRPPVWPPAQVTVQAGNIQPGRNDVRATAQKAFFEAALAGKPKPITAQAAQVDGPPRATAAQAVRSVAATEARAADRLPPPGSLVNILV
jgi:hypothetical protein